MIRFKTSILALAALGWLAPATGQAAPDKDRDRNQSSQTTQSATYSKGGDSGDCSTGTAQADLDANNVRARMFNTGQLFFNGGDGEYEVPRGSGIVSIFASGIWVGGLVDGELRMAAATYAQGTGYEFWPGPLAEDGGPPTRESCQAFDRFWKISQDDIDQYLDSGALTNDIQTWPVAQGAPTLNRTANGLDDDNDGVVDEGVDGIDNDGDAKIDERDEQEEVDTDFRRSQGLPIYDLEGGDLPDIIGNQTVWWIMNDRGNEHLETRRPPIGLEVTVQAFAFATSNAINNTTFYKYTLRYKGTSTLTNTYLGLWSDPDLGNFNDDYVGSDTELGLGFVYNADDDDDGTTGYGTRPPALGYDYFQGPLVNNDGIDNDEDGEIDEDDERIALSVFLYYNNDDTVNGNPSGGEEFYNYLQARWRDGREVTFGFDGLNDSQPPTKVMFPANPPDYWSEFDASPADGAQPNTPADRRFLMSSGPFEIGANDEQEIVFGIVWSQASTGGALASLAKLKADDILAQNAFDNDFEVPAPPAAPDVSAQPLDGAVALTWTNSRTSNNFLNTYDVFNPFSDPTADDRTYTLEGYEVFQLDSPAQSIDQGTRLAVFDRVNGITTVTDQVADEVSGQTLTVVTARGIDNGLQNSFTVRGLTNSRTYFFAVRAYAYNEASLGERVYSSPVLFGQNLISVIPSRQGSVAGGTVIQADSGDQLPVSVTTGTARGPIAARVVNPGAITGDTYEARFRNYNNGTPDDETDDFLIYDVFNVDNPVRDDDGNLVPVFDGEQFARRTMVSPLSDRRDADSNLLVDDRIPEIDGFSLDLRGVQAQNVESYIDGPGCANLNPAVAFVNNGSNQPRPLQRVVLEDVTNSGVLPLGAHLRFYSNLPVVGAPEADTLDFPNYDEIAYNFVETVKPGGGPACDGVSPNQQGCDQGLGEANGVWVYGARDTYAEDIPDFLNNGLNSTGVYHVTSSGTGPEGGGTTGGLGYVDGDAVYAPNDYEIRFTGSSYAVHLFAEGDLDPDDNVGYSVPFEIWDIGNVPVGGVNDPSDDVRLIPGIFSEVFQRTGEEFSELCDGFEYEDPAEFGTNPNNVPPNPITDRIFAYYPTTDYATWEAQAEALLFPFTDGTVVTIETNDFAVLRGEVATAESSLDDIAATPNPYRGTSEYETSANSRQIRFVNLPASATIRIFTISGTLVREIVKPNSSATVAFWDLENQRGLPVASGMYLVHVEARDPSGNPLGERVLKLGVIQRRANIDIL